MNRALDWSSALYRRLLHVCPADLRQEFGAEMTLVFEDDLRDAILERGVTGFLGVWRFATIELLEVGLSNACDAPGIVVALISFVASAFCLGGELALARFHATASSSTARLAEAVAAVVIWPSLTAAAVSFIAVRAGTRLSPLRLGAQRPPHSLRMEQP